MAHNKHKSRDYFYYGGWKDYFSFSNRVRKGLLVLFSLILIEILLLLYLHFIPPAVETYNYEKFRNEIEQFYSLTENDTTHIKTDSFLNKNTTGKEKREFFPFNPNNMHESDWKRLGFTDKQIRSIKNYVSKGGSFRTKEDLKKMYAISKDEYTEIEPFILLPEKNTVQQPGKKKKFLLVDAGVADSTELEKLPLVGPFLARKIFTYRESLGGFYSLEQLREVYGMKDSVYQVILPHLVLADSSNLRRININTADYILLVKHPYIHSGQANGILNYRKQHGPFTSVEDVKKTSLVNDELYRKIAPYLRVE